MGEAMGMNPGYLKLRKIRAAQAISRTVLVHLICQVSSQLDSLRL